MNSTTAPAATDASDPAATSSTQPENPILQGAHFFAMLGAAAGLCQHGFEAGVLVAYGLPAAVIGLMLCGIIHVAAGDPVLSAARIAMYQGTVFSKATGLFAFYWLFHWTCPEVLPTELQTLTWAQILPVCLAGGALFALPAALMARLPEETQSSPEPHAI